MDPLQVACLVAATNMGAAMLIQVRVKFCLRFLSGFLSLAYYAALGYVVSYLTVL